MSVSFALACEPCKQGRHGDCIRTVECSCYSYSVEHHFGLPPPPGSASWGEVYKEALLACLREPSDLYEHDAEKDLGDGGLGSGRWLEGD